MASGGKCRWSWMIVVLAFAASLCQAEQFGYTALRWAGLSLVILAVGPVMVSPAAMAVRSAAWRLTVKGMPILMAVFAMWYVLHLPSFGDTINFTSFMNNSMLLGPIAGMGVVIALARAIHGRSWRWGLLAFLGLAPLVASGSRLAVLATGGAGCFLIIRQKPMVGGLCGLLLLLGVCVYITHAHEHEQSDEASDSLTGALARKGIGNSRADLWQSRIAEFISSPVVGIGIGTASGSVQDENDTPMVEPGSSYLAVLAMTGVLGTAAFVSALGLLLFGFMSACQVKASDKDILSAVGIFLAVHGVAEGWVLAFGSPICFVFWLWLGNVGDAASQPFRVRKFVGCPHDRPNSGVKVPMHSTLGFRGIPLRRYGGA